jgi:hypothetical protein
MDDPSTQKKEESSTSAPQPTSAERIIKARNYRPPYREIGIYGGLLVAVCLFVLWYVLTHATPGSPYYAFKVGYFEHMVRSMWYGDERRVAYDVARLRNRFEELSGLAYDQQISAPDVIDEVATYALKSGEEIRATLIHRQRLSQGEIVSANEAVGLLRSSEILASESEELKSTFDRFSSARKDTSDVLRDVVSEYASTTNEEDVRAFLLARVQRVTEAITTVAQGSAAQKQALMRAYDANEALIENNLGLALLAILRAEESIFVDTTLYTRERGEGSIVVEAPATTTGQ